MSISKPAKFGLILAVVVLVVIIGFLINLVTLPLEKITTTTLTIVQTTTTTIEETTTLTPLTTTTRAIIIYESHCEGNECWLYEGESIDVEEEGIMYRITLKGVVDENTAVIDVDGESDKFDEHEDKRVKGLGIYLEEVFFLPKEGQVSFVQILFY